MLLYLSYRGMLPLFARGTQKRAFKATLAIVTGLATGDAVREAYAKGAEELGVSQWRELRSRDGLDVIINVAQLDTI